MKKILLSLAVAITAMTATVSSAQAAEVEFGADLVSSYVWRGAYQTGASIQPGATLSFGDFSIGAWGSTAIGLLGEENPKEVDFSLGYSIGNLSIGLCDYWWSGQGYQYFKSSDHYYEATIGYAFGDHFSAAVSTMLGGADKDFSTYIDLAYGFAIKDIDCSVGVGITPFEGAYSDGLDVCAVTLGASKTVKVTDSFELPLFTQIILSPSNDDAFIVFGMSF